MLLQNVKVKLALLVILIGLVVVSTIFLFYINSGSQDVRSKAYAPPASTSSYPACNSPNECLLSCPDGYTPVSACLGGTCCKRPDIITCNPPNTCVSSNFCPFGTKVSDCQNGSCCPPKPSAAPCVGNNGDCIQDSDCCTGQNLSCIFTAGRKFCTTRVCNNGEMRCYYNFLQTCGDNRWRDVNYCPASYCNVPAPNIGDLCKTSGASYNCFTNGALNCTNTGSGGYIEECVNYSLTLKYWCPIGCNSTTNTCNL